MNDEQYKEILETLMQQLEENQFVYDHRFDDKFRILLRSRPAVLTNENYIKIMFIGIRKARFENNSKLEEYCGIYMGLITTYMVNPNLPRPKRIEFIDFDFNETFRKTLDEAAKVGVKNLKMLRKRSMLTSGVFSLGLFLLAYFILHLPMTVSLGLVAIYLFIDFITLGNRVQSIYIKRRSEEFKSDIDADILEFNQIIKIS